MTDTVAPGADSSAAEPSTQPLLRVSNLVKEFPIRRGVFFKKQVGAVHAISDISFDVRRKKFRATKADPMRAVAENRDSIRAAAKRLIESKAFEDDGSIVVRAADI